MFHNEAFPDSDSSNGNGSCMPTPDDDEGNGATGEGVVRKKNAHDLSPQRSHSFINVVINAIRNAASLKKDDAEEKKLVPKQVERIQEEEGVAGERVFGSKMEGK